MSSNQHVILGDLHIEMSMCLRQLADIQERIAQAHAHFHLQEQEEDGLIEVPDNVIQLRTSWALHPSQT